MAVPPFLLFFFVAAHSWVYHPPNSPAVGEFIGRKLSSSNDDFQRRTLQIAPLYGSINEYAYYFLDVLIGTPPQRQSLILDSGSSLLGFPCASCGKKCGNHLDPPFDIQASSTAQSYSCTDQKCVNKGPNLCKDHQPDTCLYQQVYSEGSSIEGFFFSDLIALGDQTDNNSFIRYDYLGCHTKETVLFKTQQASGILGVSFPKGGKQPTVMDIIMSSDQVNSKVFSLCVAEDGGILAVGGYNKTYHKPSASVPSSAPGNNWWRSFLRGSPPVPVANSDALNSGIVWVRLISDASYAINLARIGLLNRWIVQGGFGDVLVDSGTTYSYFPNNIYHILAKELVDLCVRNNQLPDNQRAGSCVKGKADLICFTFPTPNGAEAPTTTDYLKRIPSFSVVFGNAGILEWGAESWLFRKTANVWCSAIENNRRKQTILGMSFMKMKDVIFDRDNSYVGFVAANCPSFQATHRPLAPDHISNLDNDKSKIDFFNTSQPSLMIEVTNETDSNIWSWAANYSLPYLSPSDDSNNGVINNGSWAIAGGVGLMVIAGLATMIAKSLRTSSYDPMTLRSSDELVGGTAGNAPTGPREEQRFPSFEELEGTSDLLEVETVR